MDAVGGKLLTCGELVTDNDNIGVGLKGCFVRGREILRGN